MMSKAVAEIFIQAGKAFSQLGDLTMQLHPNGNDSTASKWTEEEIDMLHSSIVRFSDDLNKISLSIKNRTVSQIRQALKKKAFEDAGIPAKQVPTQQVAHVIQTVPAQQVLKQQNNKSQNNQQTNSTPLQQQSPQQQQQQQQTVQIQQVQHIIPSQSAPQILQIQQSNVTTATTAMQQSTPQVVHLQPQQLQLVTTQQQSEPATVALSSPQTTSLVTTDATTSSIALKSGPDVTMTLNRINAQEHEIDVDVKLDFPGEEEVTG